MSIVQATSSFTIDLFEINGNNFLGDDREDFLEMNESLDAMVDNHVIDFFEMNESESIFGALSKHLSQNHLPGLLRPSLRA